MTYEQMALVLKGLGRDVVIGIRSAGDWYCSISGAEIADKNMLIGGGCGNGKTPELAIQDCWARYALLAPPQYVVLNAMGANRRAVRWNGFMWADVEEPTVAARG